MKAFPLPLQVLCLRESERRLQLQSGEQEAVTREMEAALQHLTLDTEHRLTEQHQEHQHDIQILMQQLQGQFLCVNVINVYECGVFLPLRCVCLLYSILTARFVLVCRERVAQETSGQVFHAMLQQL